MTPVPPPTPEDLKREPRKEYEPIVERNCDCSTCVDVRKANAYIRLYVHEKAKREEAEQRVKELEAAAKASGPIYISGTAPGCEPTPAMLRYGINQ